jgi:hypothetical protein
LPFDEKFSEVALDYSGPTPFNEFEDLRRFLAHITHERRLNLIQFAVRTGQQLAQSRREIVRVRARNLLQLRFDACEFIGQRSLEQIEFAGKMRVERFLANAQLLRQIVHGHTAKSVTEKVDARSVDNSLPVWIALSASRPRFLCLLHICDILIIMWKLIQYI